MKNRSIKVKIGRFLQNENVRIFLRWSLVVGLIVFLSWIPKL